MPRPDAPCRAYVRPSYDRHDILVYIGITKRGARRNHEHDGKQWWPFVVRQDVEHFPTRTAAAKREADLIREYRPPFNTQHNVDHALMRRLYLAFAAADPGAESWRQQLNRIGKVFPLYMLTSEYGHYFMLVPLDFAAVAKTLIIETGAVVHDENGLKVGRVCGMKSHGPFVMIEVEADVHGATGAVAKLKIEDQRKSSGVTRLAAVRLVGGENLKTARLRAKREAAARHAESVRA